MTYNPISFNVIRQALSWANVPDCTISARPPDVEMLDGSLRKSYFIEFAVDSVARWLRRYADNSLDHAEFRHAVAGCFCDDIEVICWSVSNSEILLRAQVIVRVDPFEMN